MPRAFIQNGIWRARSTDTIDPVGQRQATLRVSIAAAIATVALAALHQGTDTAPRQVSPPVPLISLPEMITTKLEDRVPLTPSPFRRRAPLADVVEATAAESETTALPRTTSSAREAEVTDTGMIRAGDVTYRLAGIILPETSRMCRRLDGLAVPCADRAHSYMQLLLKGRAVSCERAPSRSDGPHEANCRVGDADIAEQMVRQGWARPADAPEERFLLAEAAARKQKLGIWRE